MLVGASTASLNGAVLQAEMATDPPSWTSMFIAIPLVVANGESIADSLNEREGVSDFLARR